MSSDNTQDQVTEAFRDAGALESGGSGSSSSSESTQEDVTDAFEEEGLLGGGDSDASDATGGGSGEDPTTDGSDETAVTNEDVDEAVATANRNLSGRRDAAAENRARGPDASDIDEAVGSATARLSRARENIGDRIAERDRQQSAGDPEPRQGDVVTRGARDLVEGTTGTDLPTEREIVEGARSAVGGAIGVDVPSQAEAAVGSRQAVSDATGTDLPSEPELAQRSRQQVGDLIDTDIPSQEEGSERLQQEVSAATGVDVPDDVDPRSAAALAPAAVAEPTPLGEAAVGGAVLGAGIVQSGERFTTRASERLERRDQSEMPVPDERPGQRREVDVSGQQQVTAPELGLPDGTLQESELSVPDDVGLTDGELQIPEGRDRLVVQTQQSLRRGRQEPRERERPDDDAITVPEELLPDDDITLGEPEPEISDESPGRQERRRQASEREVLISPGSPGDAESVSEVDPQGQATDPQVQLTEGPEPGRSEVTPLDDSDTVQGSDVVSDQRPDVDVIGRQTPAADQRVRATPDQSARTDIGLQLDQVAEPTLTETATPTRFPDEPRQANPTVNPPENPPENPPAEATATAPAQPARARQRFDLDEDDGEGELSPLGLGFNREVEFTLDQQEVEFQQPGDGV